MRSHRLVVAGGVAARNIARAGLVAILASVALMLSKPSTVGRVGSGPNRAGMEVGHYLGLAEVARLGGIFVYTRAVAKSPRWDDALQHLTIGEATTSEVAARLGDPTSRSVAVVDSATAPVGGSETVWEYRARIGRSRFGRSMSRVITVSFRGNVASGITITEWRN